MAKVLIEFFSEKTNENILSILNGCYDRVCFLYSSERCIPTFVKKEALISLVKKLCDFEPEFYEIKNLSIGAALASMHKLWRDCDRYFIDITGGDEAFIAAAGIFFSQRGTEQVSIHQYDVTSNKKRLCYPNAEESKQSTPHFISAEEMLALNGTVPLEPPAFYDFSRGVLKTEILRLWEAIKAKPKEWNRFCALDRDPDENAHPLNQKELTPGANSIAYQTIYTRLKQIGAVSNERTLRLNGNNYARFDLNVPEKAQFLYDKAGTILEMYGALCAYESDLFHDIRVGVKLDLNGNIVYGQKPDPYNEIDLILMQNNLPIFASCKNTDPKNEQLYEIMVMTKHYGGHFATPALFCSGNATTGLKKRAEEMGIVLIDGVRSKTTEMMISILKKKFGKK